MSKSCFFISRIGDAGSPERDFSDKLLRYIIEPVLEKCGYEKPIRADHITQPGVITTQVFTHLWDDDLVIADLTGGNPNVFYELAVRHVRRKPFVHLILAGERIPFDIAPNRTLTFGFDIEQAELAKKGLEAMVNGSGEGTATVQTPLSLAVDFSTAGGGDDPVRSGIAQILSSVQEIRGLMDSPQAGEAERQERVMLTKRVDGQYAFISALHGSRHFTSRGQLEGWATKVFGGSASHVLASLDASGLFSCSVPPAMADEIAKLI
jgi:hypothetical protein